MKGKSTELRQWCLVLTQKRVYAAKAHADNRQERDLDSAENIYHNFPTSKS